jgi:hypothetical protein
MDDWERVIEALARLEAIEAAIGDPGGPFHVRDVNDLMHAVTWMGSMHSDPPDWWGDTDPLAPSDDTEEMWRAIDDRSAVLLQRFRRELVAYHERVKAHDPEHDWRPYWRTIPRG